MRYAFEIEIGAVPTMPLYFISETTTREGMMTVTEAPERAEGVVAFAASLGVEVIEFYFTLGPQDFIMKVHAPDDETVAAFLLAVRRSGNVTAEVSRAFTPDEWGEIVARLR